MLPKVFQVLAIAFAVVSFTAADYARYVEHVKQLAKNETFVKMFDEHLKLYEDKNQGLLRAAVTPFTCKSTGGEDVASPTSVHQLRPSDVNVVGALGDSITAGTGITATTVIGLLRRDRGLSWSIGGDDTIETETTLPNMLKTYNPGVYGYSTGSGVFVPKTSKFNLAEPGDKSENIPGQAEALVQRMKEDSNVDMANDWKVITIFIGGNDLCDFCDDQAKYSAENYVKNLQAGLDILHQNIPRAFVNIVPVLDISIVKKLNANLVCDALHLFGCACAAFPWDSEAEAKLQAETLRYRTLTRELIESGRYDTSDDFTVVEQPFFTETAPPPTSEGKPDLSYFSPDCFHLSLKGHRAASEALWNNMVEPEGKKRKSWSPGENFECPTEEAPYFYTRKNSPAQQLGAQAGPDTVYDSDLQQFLNQEQQPGEVTPHEDSNSHTSLIVSASVGVGVLAVLAVAVLALRRRRRTYQEEEVLLAEKWTVKGYM